MKLTILIDQDGPLADFDAAAWDEVSKLDPEMRDIDSPDEQTRRYILDHVTNRQMQRWLKRNRIEAAGWFRNLPPTPGAIDGVRGLIDAGFDVWVATKPMEANPSCRDDKAAWLRQHIPELERKLLIAPDKSMIRGNVLLDDAPKLEWFDRAEWTPVIFPRPFNREGSVWADLPSWEWGDLPDRLIAAFAMDRSKVGR